MNVPHQENPPGAPIISSDFDIISVSQQNHDTIAHRLLEPRAMPQNVLCSERRGDTCLLQINENTQHVICD